MPGLVSAGEERLSCLVSLALGISGRVYEEGEGGRIRCGDGDWESRGRQSFMRN